MDKTEYFKLADKEEDFLWDKAIIVLDTSTLGNLYCMAEEPQKTLVDIFQLIKDRIWLPGHVVYEYQKNKGELIQDSFSNYNISQDAFPGQSYPLEISEFISKNSNEKFHPYIEDSALRTIKDADKIVRENLGIIKETIKKQYNERKESLKKALEKDIVEALVNILAHGTPFIYKEQLEIVKEGELRYRNLIPPGYEDAPPFTEKKKGLQRYGDLFIWKETIAYARKNGVPVIFVCNDLKSDWYTFDKKRPTGIPRHELIKEFQDEVGQLFWMYSLKGFIEKLEEKYKDDTSLQLFSKLETVKRVLISNENKQKGKSYHDSDDVLVVQCDECEDIIIIGKDEIDWDWQIVSTDEREMGSATEYEHTENIECDNGHLIEVTFRIWEYPMGAIEDSEIECEGGEILSEFGFEDTLELFSDGEDEVDVDEDKVCSRCGQHGPVDEMGLCLDCHREYKEFMDRDD